MNVIVRDDRLYNLQFIIHYLLFGIVPLHRFSAFCFLISTFCFSARHSSLLFR